MRAAVSRYSKLAPVERAASRIAPATRADALAIMESIAMRALEKRASGSRAELMAKAGIDIREPCRSWVIMVNE